MTTQDYARILSISPKSTAITKLVESLPYGLTRKTCINELREVLWLINGWTIECGCRGIGLIIDGWLGGCYPTLLACLERIGAGNSLLYAQRAQEVCGGSVPLGEIERAKLIQKHEAEFDELDRGFNLIAREEAAGLLVKYLRENLEASFVQLYGFGPRLSD